MLSVRGISKTFAGIDVIKNVSFDVQKGQYFVLLGASGVGKSVLFETIAGLAHPDCGQVVLDEKDITDERIQDRRIGLVFQDGVLFPHMTVYENIAYSLKCRKLKKEQIRQQVAKLADDFAVSKLLRRKPSTLSGGESQRVCLARAIASEPKCLLLDEPISSLDAQSRPQIRALLRKINAEGQTIVHVTHDYTEAVSLGTHIAVMEDGRIAQSGTVEEIFQYPKSEFIAHFVGIRNFFKGQLEKPQADRPNLRQFTTADNINFSVLTDSNGGPGYVMIRSEDVIISITAGQTSARNNFEGTIVDIVRMASGVEIIVDIGPGPQLKIAAIITGESAKELDLHCGRKVWVSFKASAVKYIKQ